MLDGSRSWQVLAPRERQAFVAECRERMFSEVGAIPADGRHLHCSMVAGTVAKAFGLTGPLAGAEFGLRLVAARHADGCPGAAARPGRHGRSPAALRIAPPIPWSCFPPPRR